MSKDFNVSYHKIRAHKRGGRRVTFARDELCRRMHDVGFSYRDIAEFLCGRDHTAAIFAARRARARVQQVLSSE